MDGRTDAQTSQKQYAPPPPPNFFKVGGIITARYSTLDEKHAFASLAMFDIQYLIKEWLDTRTILYPCIKHILKQSMKIVTVSVHQKWDRLVIYWHTLVSRFSRTRVKIHFFSEKLYDKTSLIACYPSFGRQLTNRKSQLAGTTGIRSSICFSTCLLFIDLPVLHRWAQILSSIPLLLHFSRSSRGSPQILYTELP